MKHLLGMTLAVIAVNFSSATLAQGPFKPEWQSLEANYKCPEWFRDAKFGIWAHWGPQCVSGFGDWSARSIYYPNHWTFKAHKEKYGDQKEFGFKDMIPLFKTENWKPEELVTYYKSIGAKYFFALGNHHDNFDLWDSTYQEWNSVNMGPKRDVLKEWSQAAKKAGLKFGISFHADHAWIWYEGAQEYDGTLTKEDGKGKWWEGYDPQNLYAQRHPKSEPSAIWSIHKQWGWGNGASRPTEEYIENFRLRTMEAIVNYQADLIYFDVTKVPFASISDCGLRIAADFYNLSAAKNNGKADNVMFGKILNVNERKALVWDVERGAPNAIQELPWQCCTCIGGWHYDQGLYERGGYKSAPQVVRMLVDIVSKNGNMLLSVPLRGDGTFDEKEKAVLEELGAWMKINGEAIFGSRPWKKFGEGPIADSNIKIKEQGFNEGSYMKMTSEEVRFTTKGGKLYAFVMDWPKDGTARIKSLASEKVSSVRLLGHGPVAFKQTAEALEISLPKPLNRIAAVLEIDGVL